jgi:hypothetical protein
MPRQSARCVRTAERDHPGPRLAAQVPHMPSEAHEQSVLINVHRARSPSPVQQPQPQPPQPQPPQPPPAAHHFMPQHPPQHQHYPPQQPQYRQRPPAQVHPAPAGLCASCPG